MKAAFRLSLAVVFAATCVVSAEEKDAKLTPQKLAGKWEFVSGKKAGEDSEKQALASKVTIEKDLITLPAGPDMTFIIAFKLQAGTPTKIDLTIKDGPVKEGKAEGIIELKGDELKLCYTMGGKRPEKFESTKDNGAFYFVLKKAK